MVLPIVAAPIADGVVFVDGDQIGWVGRYEDYFGPAVPTYDWPGVLTPGLVNAHAHLQYTGYADMHAPGLDFFGWLAQFVPRNRGMTDDDWAASTKAGVAECLRTGTTCVADIASGPAAVAAVAEAGLPGVSYLELVGVDDARWTGGRRDALLATLAALSGSAALPGSAARSGSAGSDRSAGRRAVGVSPHSPYTLSAGVFGECVRVAREHGLRLHPHVAESRYEVEFVATGGGPFAEANRRWELSMELMRAAGGLSPVAYVDRLGGLGRDVHLAHGVHVSDEDRALLRERGTAVALCARSNAALGCGQAPVAAYRAEGNAVAVGTDSRASVPSLDLLAELAALRELALAQGSPADGLDQWLVEAATVGGARAMALADVGELSVAARADLAVFDVPVGGNPHTALVRHGAGRCVGTVLAGQVVHG
jgi:cytosine/adenosine deaminase-related metal-dependent hydrolase